jgi:rod shape-determining protein MreD
LQRGLDDRLTWFQNTGGYAKVELPWLIAAFVAACLPAGSAPTAGLLIGLAYDLTGAGPIGANALGLLLGTWVVTKIRPSRPVEFLVAAVACIIAAAIVTTLVGLLRTGGQGLPGGVLTALLTAALAAALAWPLWKLRAKVLVSERRF